MRHPCWPPFQRRAFSPKPAYSKQKDQKLIAWLPRHVDADKALARKRPNTLRLWEVWECPCADRHRFQNSRPRKPFFLDPGLVNIDHLLPNKQLTLTVGYVQLSW